MDRGASTCTPGLLTRANCRRDPHDSPPDPVEQSVAQRPTQSNELLREVREGLSKHNGVADELTFAFEVWCVRPFEMIQASPDAKDILESGYEFAAEITLQAFSDFENILSDVLRPIISSQAEKNLSSEQLAHILTTASQGFKESASSAVQLRQMIKGLVTVVLAGLQKQRESS